jgi:hypothetical protein
MGAAPRDGAGRVASAGRDYLDERPHRPADTSGAVLHTARADYEEAQPAMVGRE